MNSYINLFVFLKNEKRFLIFLFIFSFFVRAMVFGFFSSKHRRYFFGDSGNYHEVGAQISKGHGITKTDGSYNFYRVPGYSFFLGTIYKLLRQSEKQALWIQVFLASILPVLIFCLSLILFPSNLLLAKLSSFYSALHLGYVLYSGLMMTESIFCLFFFLFLILFLSNFNFVFCKKKVDIFSYKSMFIAGVFLGIASLIRPVGHYLLFVIFLMLCLSKGIFFEKLKCSAAFFFGWFFIIMWWLLRNYVLTGFIFFHTLPGHHFLFYCAVPVDMAINNNSYSKSCIKLRDQEWPNLIKEKEKRLGRKLKEIEICKLGEKLAFSYICKKPFLVCKNAFYNMIKTTIFPYFYDIFAIINYKGYWCYKKEQTFLQNLINRFLFPSVKNNFLKVIMLLEIIFSLFILIGFIVGIIKSFFNSDLLCITLKILPIVVMFIFLTLAIGYARFRLPIEPFLIIFSFYFWLNIFKVSRWVKV